MFCLLTKVKNHKKIVNWKEESGFFSATRFEWISRLFISQLGLGALHKKNHHSALLRTVILNVVIIVCIE